MLQGCDPTNYARVHKKPKCPVPGCKEKLTTINTYSCKSCSTEVCLKHRFPGDHDCTNRAGNGAKSIIMLFRARYVPGDQNSEQGKYVVTRRQS